MQIIFCMAGGIVVVSFARSSGLTLPNSIVFPRLTPGATIWRPLRGLRADPGMNLEIYDAPHEGLGVEHP